MRKKQTVKIPFGIGDVVRYKNDTRTDIILKVEIYGINQYDYATHRRAWLSHKDLVLVEKASEASIRELVASRMEE